MSSETIDGSLLPTNASSSSSHTASLADRLEHNLLMSSDVTRWLYWFEALEKAEPRDLPRLVHLAGSNLNLIRLLASRFAERYPQETFDLLVAHCRKGDPVLGQEFGWRFLREWTKRDPQKIVTALNNTKNFGLRDIWRSNVAGSLFDVDPELGLKTMWDWHIEHFSPNLDNVETWAARDPRHAAEVTLQNPAGHAAEKVIETVARQWAKLDPIAALAFAAENQNELGSKLASTTVLEWAGRDLDGAAAWLARNDSSTLNRLAPSFIEAWAKTDPEAALSWSQSNLAGSALDRATGAAARGLARKDVTKAAGMVLELPPSSARAEAALAVAEQWTPRTWGDGEKSTPPALPNWLRQLDPDSLQRVLKETSSGWAEADPKAFSAFLQNPEMKGVPWAAYYSAATTLARQTPLDALAWAERVDPEQRLAAGATAFAQWQRSQPDFAMAWLNELPANDPRGPAFLETAIRWMAWDTQGAERINKLPLDQQTIARRVIQNMEFRDETLRTQLLSRLRSSR